MIAGTLIRAFGLALATMLQPPSAMAVEEADRAAGQIVIDRQIEAFRRDDAAGAFSFASPTIREMFGSDERFMAMVRDGYKAVYRQRSYEFGPVRDVDDGFEQAVRIQDNEGVDWDAVYTLQRQPDGSWRISGCRLVKRPGESATIRRSVVA